MKLIFLKKRYAFIALFLLLFFYLGSNYVWLNLNEFPPFADEAYHLLRTLDYFDILTRPSGHIFPAFFKIDDLRPPFFHLFTAFLNTICGNPRLASVMTNIFFAGVLFFSIYYMGKKLQDSKTGLLAAFIAAMYPFVFGLSRIARPDFVSMALVCLSMCCLLYTDRFRRILPSIALGLFLGLGALTSLTFIAFVIGPLLTMITIVFLNKNSIPVKKGTLLNLCSAVIIAILVGGIWYFPKLAFLLKTYSGYACFQEVDQVFAPKIFSLPFLTFYLRSLINGQISPFFFILFLIGLIVIFKNRGLNPLLYSWIIVSYAIFTSIKFKEFRDTSEFLPAFALITAAGILKIKKQWLKRCMVSVIILGGLSQYFIVSYTNPSSTGIKVSFFNGKLAEGLTISSYLYPITEVFFHYPRKGDWKVEEVILAIQKEDFAYKSNLSVGITDAYIDVKTDWFNPLRLSTWHENFVTANGDAINYFIRTNGLSYNVISLSRWKEDWRKIPLLDFIISVNKIENLAPLIPQHYKLILQTKVPDESPVYVYKRLF